MIYVPSSNITNITEALQTTPPWVWDFQAGFKLFTKCGGLCLNTLIVLLFCKFSTVRSPFTVYVFNLTCANLLNTVFLYPLQLINQLNSSTHFTLSFCVLVRYAQYLIPAYINNAHLLIALSRLWSISWPVSYGRYHQSRSLLRPFWICLSLQIYLHVVLLPGIVVDALNPRILPETFHCSPAVVGLDGWFLPAQLIVYGGPVLCVILVYPFTCYKIYSDIRSRTRRVYAENSSFSKVDTRKSHLELASRGGNVVSVRKLVVKDEAALSVITSNLICHRRLIKPTGYGFITLTCLTVTVAFTLLPSQVQYTLIAFGLRSPIDSNIGSFLYALMQVFDPLMFLVTIKSLRYAVRSLCFPVRG